MVGDRISYHSEPGEVQFIVSGVSGEPVMDWYAETFPGGGLIITANAFGDVFVRAQEIDEDVEFVARR